MMGESEMAIAGGVDVLLDEKPYVVLSQGKALSPDGKCHTFDQKANGFVPGEGSGAVILKLLDKALEDGDRIYAVIDAIAVNNDGHTMGITTPNMDAQKSVIQETLEKGNINPETISYVETHGTGTMIGDPIELKALTQVYKNYTDKTQFCAVGTVKSNFGHLLSAAGIASFIKVTLAIYNQKLPPTLNCETPNTRFAFKESPFYPNTTLKEWGTELRRAAISSFGFGGTNAHVVVENVKQPIESIRRISLPRPMYRLSRYWAKDKNDFNKQDEYRNIFKAVFDQKLSTKDASELLTIMKVTI
jgi:acyl transferase domain-containing protein